MEHLDIPFIYVQDNLKFNQNIDNVFLSVW